MKLVLAEPKYLRESISIISDLVNEVTFNIDKDKIELIAMDPANVAMVIFRLLSSAFVEYNVEKETKISVSLDNLKQILRRAKPSDTLIISLDSSKNRLNINLKGDSMRSFNLALIDVESEHQKIPNLKFPLKVEMPTTIFNEAIEDMDVVSESVALTAELNKFIVQAESKLNDARVEIPNDDISINLSKEGKISSKYSIEYLKKIIKGAKLADNVVLQFDKEYPLRVEYKVIDKLDLVFILAPRVSTD